MMADRPPILAGGIPPSGARQPPSPACTTAALRTQARRRRAPPIPAAALPPWSPPHNTPTPIYAEQSSHSRARRPARRQSRARAAKFGGPPPRKSPSPRRWRRSPRRRHPPPSSIIHRLRRCSDDAIVHELRRRDRAPPPNFTGRAAPRSAPPPELPSGGTIPCHRCRQEHVDPTRNPSRRPESHDATSTAFPAPKARRSSSLVDFTTKSSVMSGDTPPLHPSQNRRKSQPPTPPSPTVRRRCSTPLRRHSIHRRPSLASDLRSSPLGSPPFHSPHQRVRRFRNPSTPTLPLPCIRAMFTFFGDTFDRPADSPPRRRARSSSTRTIPSHLRPRYILPTTPLPRPKVTHPRPRLSSAQTVTSLPDPSTTGGPHRAAPESPATVRSHPPLGCVSSNPTTSPNMPRSPDVQFHPRPDPPCRPPPSPIGLCVIIWCGGCVVI